MERIPIIRIDDFLLVSIQVDLHDRLAIRLQDELADQVVSSNAKGVLIDISSLAIVDSFIGRLLNNIAVMTRAMGAETVVVGMQPVVAITIVELGLSLANVKTALNVNKGIELLKVKVNPVRE